MRVWYGIYSKICYPRVPLHLSGGFQDFVGLERSRHEDQQLHQQDENRPDQTDDHTLYDV